MKETSAVPDQFDPNKITISQSSSFIAFEAVSYFKQLISDVLNYLRKNVTNNEEQQIIESTMYENPMNTLWCLSWVGGMSYLVDVFMFLSSAPGQQTTSEKEFKCLNHWVTPQRNALGRESLKAITMIHGKVLGEDLNAKERTNSTKAETSCLLLMKMYGFDKIPEISDEFKKLKKRIESKKYDVSRVKSYVSEFSIVSIIMYLNYI